MDTALTNQGALVEEVVSALKTGLDNLNIGGGHNTTRLMEHFQGKRTYSYIIYQYWRGNEGRRQETMTEGYFSSLIQDLSISGGGGGSRFDT